MTLINLILSLVLLLLVAALLYFRMSGREIDKPSEERVYTVDAMTAFVKQALHERTSSNLYDLGLSEEEFRRRKSKRLELKKALRGCTSGDLRDKAYITQVLADLLIRQYGLGESNINRVIPFDDPYELTPQDQFEILLFLYKKRYRYDALSELIRKFDLDRPKLGIEDGKTESYRITVEEIHEIYKKEARRLTLDDKIQIVAQRIYQQYKGFSVVDEIRDMRIDGVSGGVSGLPPSVWEGEWELDANGLLQEVPKSHDSVWIFYKGKSIHLPFLSFGSEQELRRVCQNIYKHNLPGQLSEATGYKVNEMADGSRVVVLRPRFSESWAFFVRKFDVQSATLEQLIRDPNAELPIGLIAYLVKGARITSITGAQGSGKTTLLMAMVRYIPAIFPIRVQEMSFELHLRKIYKDRNILSFRETETISGQDGLDIQKKTDGTVNILGEVATDPVAAWMIQMAQVASLFTLFTHHAKTFRDLVLSLRNSLLKTGVFTNEHVAEQQVVSVLNFDIHLKRDVDGHRYIERITECVPLEQEMAYPVSYRDADTLDDKMAAFMETATEYFRRSTDRTLYAERNIVEFRDGRYVAVHPISERNRREMEEQMTGSERSAFSAFLTAHWRDTGGY
ncbi:Flp pilus assembly complex ATPase component TadA [Cohnella zeiphila]|uniref:Flp pilus assembly complex ATPase component TadA n=1 Tax=Cohnella zeiphila TaxID=2761120 RepID=A0A7X0SMP2_9BACL|nr:Flp pilus assembly complex ATPase component TadA [Cohnella zeiphila]MBB6732792.1 Flp pilus assembly complex ATPase component TadA [Cohnella zeiphila]